ncbi:MAG: YbbR-like domain-containing protein [Christensenellales bacterium]|jgi:YbbR domain-containing protein
MPEPIKSDANTQNNNASPQGNGFFSRFGAREVIFMLISLLFAVVIWVYVLNVENPTREKIVRDVQISFSGEERLNSNQKLTVKGDRNAILTDATVVINVPANLYSEIKAESITAQLDLSGISTPGKHTIKVTARVQGFSDVSIVSISPAEVTVDIDVIRERVLPVEIRYFGEMPEGFWRGEVALTPSSISLIGAASELGQINNAVVEVDLENTTESVYETANIILYDKDGNEIDASKFTGDLPYATVQMDVLPTKTVPIDVMGSLVGVDEIHPGYELTDITVNPHPTVTIAAKQEFLDTIDSIGIETVSLTGASESRLLMDVNLQIPAGVRRISTESYNVSIHIEEKFDTLNFFDIPIEIRNLAPGFKAALSIDEGKLTINGPLSAINGIKRDQVALYIDASGLGEGTHEMTVYSETGSAYSTTTSVPWPGSVTLTLTPSGNGSR